MSNLPEKSIDSVYPVTCRLIGDEVLPGLKDEFGSGIEGFPGFIAMKHKEFGLEQYLSDLAIIELGYFELIHVNGPVPTGTEDLMVNPTLKLLKLSWKNLLSVLINDSSGDVVPVRGEELVIMWRDPLSGEARIEKASSGDLLVLKLIVEELDRDRIAQEGGLTVGAVDDAVSRAVNKGIFIQPPSKIKRDPVIFHEIKNSGDEFLVADVFTLQWHITQVCDLHCKHCYDRSDRTVLQYEDAVRILDDMRSFCLTRNVRGHISFSGGNPLMHPDFIKIYRAASDRGFSLAILGNVAPKKQLEELIAIQRPSHYQVSLEGLEDHNDEIRGKGYFKRVMQFLPLLRELGIYSMVMLTLTRGNMDQVIPLAEELRDKVDSFTFNRLSLVGEGANLEMADNKRFRKFLEDYMAAAEKNPVMRMKDNFINIIKHERGQQPFGGCAGFGCSAAFNFITVLPDGEVHACRKFPSTIGNIYEQSIADIYDSDLAQKYRSGAKACNDCVIRPVCGGCLAVAHSFGINVFEEHDPFCFINKSARVR